MICDNATYNLKELMRHYRTVCIIHIKNIDDLELWLPLRFNQARHIHLERCSFIDVNNFITQSVENIKLERCNEHAVDKTALIPNLEKYPNIKRLTVY
jgi:hypothetical protein